MSDHAWIVVHTALLLVFAGLLLLVTKTTQAELALLADRLGRVEGGGLANVANPLPVAETGRPVEPEQV